MNRYAFYFVVSLLAFGFGVSFVYLYIYKLDNQFETLSAITQNDTSEPSHPNLAALEKSSAEIKSISGVDIILLLYQPTIEKWQKGAKIAKIVKHSSENLRPILEIGQRHKIEFETESIYKTQLVDLNRDGEKELIIFQKIFSEHPDEQNQWNILIFEKYRECIVIIFDEKRINEYQILKTKTNSFSDIALIHNDKESENSFVQVFKSNGKIYNILTCYEEIRRYQDRKGIWHKLKKSRIEHPGDCC